MALESLEMEDGSNLTWLPTIIRAPATGFLFQYYEQFTRDVAQFLDR
jgi:hypothetical protein